MKVVIQRVNSAKVNKAKIGKGLFILLGIKKGDTQKQADELINKILKLRIIADEAGKMNLSIQDVKQEILLVSQFTLYANAKDGNRPSFIEAEEPTKAKLLYDYMVKKFKDTGLNIQTGTFGNYMEIEAILDGPVTIVLEN